MKNKWLGFIMLPTMAGGMLMAAPQDSTQTPPPPAQHQFQHRRGARLAAYLNLTPDQQQAFKAEMKGAWSAAAPIRQQLSQVRQQMFQAVRANDTAKIQQLSSQEGALKGQIGALRGQAFARLYQSLTPDQRAKADQLPAMTHQMRQHRMQNRQNQNNG